VTFSPVSSPAGRLSFPRVRVLNHGEDGMRKKTFSDEQITPALREAEMGTPVTIAEIDCSIAHP